MINVLTDPRVMATLSEAAKWPMSAEEVHRQRVDYIVTSLGGGPAITKDRVERELERLRIGRL